MIPALLTALLLAQSPGPVDPNAPLPPNHPPLSGGAAAEPMPQAQGQLPPNHPPVSGDPQAARPTDDLVKQLDAQPDLKTREKTFEIAASIGTLYYNHGRWADAVEFLGQAWAKGAPVRQAYLKAGGKPQGTCRSPQLTLQEALAQPGCLRNALENVFEAGQLRAMALFLAGDTKGALAQLDEVLKVDPEFPAGLYSRGAVRFDTGSDDLAALRKAKADLEKVAKLEPGTPRGLRSAQLAARAGELISAGGATQLARKSSELRKKSAPAEAPAAAAQPAPAAATAEGAIAPLSQQTIEAIQQVELTPEARERMAKLVADGEALLAKDKYQEALTNYMQVMPYEPNNGRVRAGLAWAMLGVKRPAAERVWGVAVSADPASVEMLGHALKAQGNPAAAKALWQKLAQSDPAYAQRVGLADKLK